MQPLVSQGPGEQGTTFVSPGAEYYPPRSSLDDRPWDSDFRTLELTPLGPSLESQAFGFSLTIIISFLGSEIFGVTLSQAARTQGTPAHRRPARGLPSLRDVSQFQYVWSVAYGLTTA